MMRVHGATMCIGLLVAFAVGCHTARFDPRAPVPAAALPALQSVGRSSQIEPWWLQPSTDRFTLGPGDRLDIEILGEADTQATCVVGPDGKIYYYLMPGVDVWGLTLSQTKKRLEEGLKTYLTGQQQVAVSLRGVESKRVWLLGRFRSPGMYPLSAPTTLLEAISEAGGPAVLSGLEAIDPNAGPMRRNDDLGDLNRAFIIRQGQSLPVDFERLLRQGDMSQNIYIEPDDFVYLPSKVVDSVYVLGAVARPRMVSMTETPRLVAAIAGAGGTVKGAYLTDVAIVRGSLTQPKVAVVNAQAILKGGAPDVALAPGDIVYVPFEPYGVLVRYVDLILQTFVRTIGANEGVRAIDRNAPIAGVSVPVGGK